MRRKLAMLLVVAFVPTLGAAACGQAVEDRVKQEVDKQVEKGQKRVQQEVDKQVKEGQKRIDKELEKGQKRLEKEAGKVQKQVEEGARKQAGGGQ